MAKKQIVIIGTKPNVSVLKMAKALKGTNKYELIFVSLTKITDKFSIDTFDRIISFELDLNITSKNFSKFIRQLYNKRSRYYIKKVNELNPYIKIIHSTNIISTLAFYFTNGRHKLYYYHDIWHYYKGKLSLKKGSGLKQRTINVLIEKISIRKSDGIINKCGMNSLKYLDHKVKVPVLDFLPLCLDELIIPLVDKPKNDEIHLVYAGTLWDFWKGHASFKEMIEKIISQKIHLHFFPSTMKKQAIKIVSEIDKKSEYFHLYPNQTVEDINELISKYDYAIHLDFFDDSVDPLWINTGMSAKIFGYLEAGLPTLINKRFKNMTKILEDNNVGKGISYNELGNLREILSNYNYPSNKTIKKAQDKFRISNYTHQLEEFFEKIHNS